MTADAGDPLESGGGRDGVRGVGVKSGAGRDAWFWIAGWCACGCRVEKSIEAASFSGCGEGSGVGEHVLSGGDDGVRARGSDFDPVGEVQTAGDEVGDGLLSVLRPERWKEGVEAREVAGDSDGMDAGIDGAEQSSHGASAGAAEGTDAVGVDFRAR